MHFIEGFSIGFLAPKKLKTNNNNNNNNNNNKIKELSVLSYIPKTSKAKLLFDLLSSFLRTLLIG
jgi:hypothetical protein